MSGVLKNTIILSNFCKNEVFKQIVEKYRIRLSRRTIWSEVKEDPLLLFYLRPNFQEFQIEQDLILFHFWFTVLRVQSQTNWENNLAPKLKINLPSYSAFCQKNQLKMRLGGECK